MVAQKATGEGEYRIFAPCGRCREVIGDFGKDIWVILGTLEETFKMMVSDLIPMK